MADSVGSDYWCVYNDCVQDAPLSLWADLWPSSVGGCDGAIPSLFDEIDQQDGMENGSTVLQPASSATDELVKQQDQQYSEQLNMNENRDDEWVSDSGAHLIDTVSPDVPSFASDDVSREFSDENCESNSRFVLSVDGESVASQNVVDVSLAVEPGLADADEPTVCSVGDDSVSDTSEHSSHGSLVDSHNLNNSGKNIKRKFSALDCSHDASVSRGKVRVLPKRLAAHRQRITSDVFSDDDDLFDGYLNHKISKQRRSVDNEVSSSERAVCNELNRNALNARLNRQKKKAYIASLEASQSQLTDENARLKSAVTDLKSECDRLCNEVDYLKAVLANDSALAHIIGGLKGSCGVHLSTQFGTSTGKRLQNVEMDHDYVPLSKVHRRRYNSQRGGVCLHVHQSKVSLEFCERCAQMSNGV